MKNKLLVKLFSSGLQAVAVQILGGLFFYLISIYLSKDNFGIISWMNAVTLFLTTVLGLGLDQVVVRRIAVSQRSDWAAGAFFTHSVIGFLVTFLALLLLQTFLKDQDVYQLLPWFFAAQGLVYIGIPLKQFLNAKEKFTPYGVIAIVSNAGKIVAAFVLYHQQQLDIHGVILILVGSAAFELGCLLIYLLAKTTFRFRFPLKAYTKLLKEAAVPYLSVLFDMSLSRMDWILLGAIASNTILADYSFAYRSFELARLPMVIIAPIILPRLSRLMAANNNQPDAATRQSINSFGTVELFFAVMIPLMLNILWEPVMMLITKGKYGHSNAWEFLMLSVCVPLQLFINLLWSLSFGARKYKSVTTITVICAVTNIGLNIILIPIYGGNGAAAAFLLTTLLQCSLYYMLVGKQILTTLLQCSLYYMLVGKQIMAMQLRPALLFIVFAVLVYLLVIHINAPLMGKLIIAIALYFSASILSKQITKPHWYHFKNFLTQ